ncbi:hypothetical protein LOTGIDRAFT_238001 [Lottia gigantea]|uniref:Uncharacterized protein n=1 Tax=Lottia gigantea TaxID=225164 RepID=V4CJM0_LOTGI|nr:hypothetical protein LOTGIDRAFT_238001 [Lottia gigantea]ESP02375.1 hypothetical protein LOTGIDRAFT_238001 [Lottia gigantea]
MKVACLIAVVCFGVIAAVDNIHDDHSGHAARQGIAFNGENSKALNRHAHSGKEQLSHKAGHQNNQVHSGFGQNQKVAKSNRGFAHQDDDQSSALYDTLANQAANEAVRNANSVFKDGQFKQNDVANKAGFNQANAQKKSFNRGKVLNDNISYGFDKKFNKHVGEKGGFEEELGTNSHKLDEFRERQRALNLRRGNHASALDRANAQKAVREGKFNKNAAQKAIHNNKYANKDNRLDRAQKRADLQDVAYDKKDKRFRANQRGKDQSVRKFDDFNVKDAQFNRNDASDAHGKKGENAQRFYQDGKHGRNGAGIAGHGAGHSGVHGGKGGRNGATLGQVGANGAKKSALYGETAKHIQNANNHNARKAGKHAAALNDYQRAKDLYDVDQIKSLRDSRRGNLKNAVHNSANGGFNNKNAAAAKSASASNRQFADAAARKHASQAKKDLDEAKFDKENSKRILSDRHQNQRKLKRFFHDKQEGGNNFERLKFNRKRIESDFGNQQAAAAQSAKKFNVAHNQNAFTADRRKDENVHARQAKGQKHKRNKAASINGHHKKNTGKVAQSANAAQGYKQNAAQKNYHDNNVAQIQGRQGVQENVGQGNHGRGIQHIGGTHGNGGFSNFGNNFHSFGNNGFGISPVKSGRVGYKSNNSGFGGFGFQNKPRGNVGGFAPFRFSFSNFRK